MKHTLLFILLLASLMAFCQKTPHHIYTFDGIVRKPWTFYKVIRSHLQPLTDSEQVKNKHWDKFILTVRDINVDCFGDSADVTIIYNSDKFQYVLKRSAPNKYTFNNGTHNLMVTIKSPLICEFYFMKGNEAASVSNMDWEMTNDR